jgi:hypothetical protein
MVNNQKHPSFLFHYFEKKDGPFSNLSDLPISQAHEILSDIRKEGQRFASKRTDDYLAKRIKIEEKIRTLFINKGGKPLRDKPQYMILGECQWVKSWYNEGGEIKLNLDLFDSSIISFTYGDTFPTFYYKDGKPYRNMIYLKNDLDYLIDNFGLPQKVNKNGELGPDRYIEAQIWDNGPIQKYLPA